MKRGFQYTCPHPGAITQYVASFSDVQRVKVCPACTKAINDNADDPRSIDPTVTGAIRLRDTKHATS